MTFHIFIAQACFPSYNSKLVTVVLLGLWQDATWSIKDFSTSCFFYYLCPFLCIFFFIWRLFFHRCNDAIDCLKVIDVFFQYLKRRFDSQMLATTITCTSISKCLSISSKHGFLMVASVGINSHYGLSWTNARLS